jgi:hypothetical protein
MARSQVDVQKTNGKYLINLIGSLDEDMSFKSIKIDGAEEVVINFEKVNGIKSFGIRELIRWLNNYRDVKITYTRCPKIVVDQINIVDGFLPKNATVESFYVPYYFEDTGEETLFLFRFGIEFDGTNITPPEAVFDSKGNKMEMDVIWTKYFHFIEGKNKRRAS